MDDHEILQQLLSLEKEASLLVYEAQAEADRRITEGENQNRLRYDECYAAEVDSLEEDYTKNLAALKEKYRQQLDTYRESLKTQPVNMEAFSALAKKLLIINEA